MSLSINSCDISVFGYFIKMLKDISMVIINICNILFANHKFLDFFPEQEEISVAIFTSTSLICEFINLKLTFLAILRYLPLYNISGVIKRKN